MGEQALVGLNTAPFDMGVGVDDMNPSTYAVYIQQPRELTLPATYYSGHGARFEAVRKAFKDTVGKLFKLAGYKGSPAKVLALEASLAAMTVPPELLENPLASYNPTTFSNFTAEFPALMPYFAVVKKAYSRLGGQSKLINSTPGYFKALQKLLGNATVAADGSLADLMAWRILEQYGDSLGKESSEALHSFFG